MNNKVQKKRNFFSYNSFLRKNRRGLSAVVTTLIIILLALVAIGTLCAVVGSLISEGTGDIGLEQFTLDLSIKNAYIDTADLDNIKVRVRRNVGAGEITGIRFIFFNGVDSIAVSKETSLTELGEQTFSFTPIELEDINEGDSVSIAPLFESGSGKEKTGAVTDTAQIRSGAPGGSGIPECNDGIDNDSDNLTDGFDLGCEDLEDNDETNCGDAVCEGAETCSSCSLDCGSCNGASCSVNGDCASGNCFRDSDFDGYAATSGAKICKASASSGTDCNDGDSTRWRNRYLDGDGDSYGVGSLVCVGNHGGYADNNNDCYDSNSNAKPGQTTYFATDRGDGSFDYNCVGGEQKETNWNCVTTMDWSGCAANKPSGTTGYVTSVPACGGSATYRACDLWQSPACTTGFLSASAIGEATCGFDCPTSFNADSWTQGDFTQQIKCR